MIKEGKGEPTVPMAPPGSAPPHSSHTPRSRREHHQAEPSYPTSTAMREVLTQAVAAGGSGEPVLNFPKSKAFAHVRHMFQNTLWWFAKSV